MAEASSLNSDATRTIQPPTSGPRRMAFLLGPILVASFAMTFDPALFPLKPGLDPSYTYAFNRAIADGRTFGGDFISTYGPLGFLIVAHDLDRLSDRRLAFEFGKAVVLAVVVAAYAHSLALGTWGAVLAALVLTSVLGAQTREYQGLGVSVLAVLIALRGRGSAAVISSFGCGALAGVCLLVKGSLGFGCLLTLAVAQFWWVLKREWKKLIASAAGAVIVLAGCWILLTGGLAGLASWLGVTWLLASEYSTAMSRPEPGVSRLAALFAVLALGLGLYAALQPRSRALGTLLACVAPLFVLWKHVIVRPVLQRWSVFVLFGLFLVLLVVLDSLPVRRWRGSLVIPAATALVLTSAWSGVRRSPLDPPLNVRVMPLWKHLAEPWLAPGIGWLRELGDFSTYRQDTAKLSADLLRGLALPRGDRTMLRGHTVEPYPWEVAYLAANPGQRWVLRPSPASFASYAEALDRRNADHFRGPERPEYVLWHEPSCQSIDGRHLFWDEPLTLAALVDNYDLEARQPQFLMLRARTRPRFAAGRDLGGQALSVGSSVRVPSARGALLAQIVAPPSPARLLVRAVYREDPLWLAVDFASGQHKPLRFVAGTAGSGLWINPLPVDEDGLCRLFAGTAASDTVVSLSLQPSWVWRLAPPPLLRWRELIPDADSDDHGR